MRQKASQQFSTEGHRASQLLKRQGQHKDKRRKRTFALRIAPSLPPWKKPCPSSIIIAYLVPISSAMVGDGHLVGKGQSYPNTEVKHQKKLKEAGIWGGHPQNWVAKDLESFVLNAQFCQ